MENEWTKWLHERAYAFWESDNRPEGRHDEHWRRAEEELRQVDGRQDAPAQDDTAVPEPSAKD